MSPLEAERNKITGFAISQFSIGSGPFGKVTIFLIILGILAIVLLGGYQVMLSYDLSPEDIMSFIAKKRGNYAYRKISNSRISSVGSKDSVYISSSYDTITELINWAHRHVNNNEIEQAKILYPKIEILYRNLRKEDKLRVFDECMKLQQRLQK